MSYKTFDELGKIAESEAVTATASSTGVNIEGLSIGSASYVAAVNIEAEAGTFDASNKYTIAVQASDAIGGTYVTVGNLATVLGAGKHEIGFTSEQLNSLVTGANYFRVTATKVGSTATGITYTAFISKV